MQTDSCLPVTVASYAFNKSFRLLTAKDYKPVFDNARIKASTQQVLILSTPNQRDYPRLGLVIAKKHIRLAVDRNRVKRVIRESFRLHRPQLPALDIVVLARPKLGQLDNTELHAMMEQLWRKLQHKNHKLHQSP